MTVAELLKSLGGVPDGSGVTFTAKDGYEMTMSADQVKNGKFVAYDVSTGDEITVDGPLAARGRVRERGRRRPTRRPTAPSAWPF